jgi:hypothetical protein
MITGVFFHEKFRGEEWLIIGDIWCGVKRDLTSRTA